MLSVLRRATTRCASRTVLVKVLNKRYASTLTPHTTGGQSSDLHVITPPTNEQRSLNAKVPTSSHNISGAAGIKRPGDQTNIDQNSSPLKIPIRPYSLTHRSGDRDRKFTVNGTIDNPTGLFYVIPNNDVLLAAIHNKDYIMATGHRGSGKSTRAYYAMHNQLQEYLPLMVSLQGVACTSVAKFWKSLGVAIKRRWKWPSDLPDIVDETTFQEFFGYYAGKRIVLFLDEFDLLLRNPEAQVALYDALRFMKNKDDRPSLYGLQAVVAIGPFNILAYTKENLSPFNVADHWAIPYFTWVQVEKLFREFEQLADITLEDGIVKRIFEITSGHPGLVCFCGKQIHEFLIPGAERHLTLRQWKEYESTSLTRHVTTGWRTVLALSEEVKEPQYEDYLVRNVLSTNSPCVPYDDQDTVQLGLIGLGALAKISDKFVDVPSPLIRHVLFRSLAVSTKPQLNTFVVHKTRLDVCALLQRINYFDADLMRAAPEVTYKQNKTIGADESAGEPVPHEDTYVFQLFRVILASVPKHWTAFTRMIGPHSSRADIVLDDNRECTRVVLELMAHEADGPVTTRGTVMEHLHRSSTKYAKIDSVKEVWVINFTTRQPSDEAKRGYVWPEDAGVVDKSAGDGVSVKIIHVWHDLAWTTAKITARSKQGDAYAYTTTPVDLKQ